MKFRALTLVVALSFLCVGSYAQTKDNQTPATTSTGTATTDNAATAPSADQSSAQPTVNDQTQPQAQSKDTAKTPKQGSKDDVEAIGNRKVGGRGVGNWYSLDSEIAMGKQYAQQVESSVKLVQDPVVNEYVNRIGQNLVRNSDAKVPFTIKVVDSDEVNAFALPGGFFYVNSGLILAADNESEMAGVMAHEIAHVAARHTMRQMTRSQMLNLATIPLIFVPMGPGIYYGTQAALSLGVPAAFLKFQRGFEAEADYLGVQYMYKAGYDPQSFVAFFEKIQAKEKQKPGTLSKAFSTHPQTPDRIEKSQMEIASILPAKPEYILDTSEFEDVKARLAAIENKRKITDPKDANKPTLRRTTNTNGDSTNSSGDDRPTLKRRDQ